MKQAHSRGFSLVELMVGLTVGLFVLAGVGAVYVTTTRSSSETLVANRLNQEMRALLDVMDFDLRRAGFGVTDAASIAIHNNGACIVYLYEFAGAPRHSGFRLDRGQIEMKTGGTLADCTSGTWEAITDSSMITVSTLTFAAGNSECFDRITTAGINCDDLIAGVEARRIDITLNARLTSDAAVAMQANESIKVRNDRVM